MSVLIAHLAELDERRLAVGRGFPSLYEYCVLLLKFSEGEAYRRIRAVRAVRKRPELLRHLEDGTLTLNSLVLLHPHLETAHGDEVLNRALGLGTKRLEMMLAEYISSPAARDVIRFVGMEAPTLVVPAESILLSPDKQAVEVELVGFPSPSVPEVSSVAVESDIVAPRKLIRVAFTADEDLYKMVRRCQQLMRHKYPDGRLEGIFRDALKLLIEEKDLGLRTAKAAARKARRHAAKSSLC